MKMANNFMKNNNKNTKNVHVIIKQQSFSELALTDPSRNVLQTLDYGENIGDKKFSVEHVLRKSTFPMFNYVFYGYFIIALKVFTHLRKWDSSGIDVQNH